MNCLMKINDEFLFSKTQVRVEEERSHLRMIDLGFGEQEVRVNLDSPKKTEESLPRMLKKELGLLGINYRVDVRLSILRNRKSVVMSS